MSRRVFLLGLGLALVAGAFLLTDALLWRPGVTEANARRVRPGMRLEEVETILGEHPHKEFVRAELRRLSEFGFANTQYLATWSSDEGRALIWLDLGGRVGDVEFERFRGRAFFSRLRAWLGW
jgi:hypothetical protein